MTQWKWELTRVSTNVVQCDAGVVPDGDGEKTSRRHKVQKRIRTEFRELAAETRTPGYEGEQYPIERSKAEVEQRLAAIESELARRTE